MKTHHMITFFFYIFSIVAGAQSMALNNPEKSIRFIEDYIGVAGKNDIDFHVIAINRDKYKVRYDGFHIGIEKAPRKKVLGDEDALIPFIKDISNLNFVKGSEKGKEYLRERLDDGHVLFVSHILDSRGSSNDVYNIFELMKAEGNNIDNKDIYKKGWFALQDKMRAAIINRIKEEEKQYTHLVLMSTGWNTKQMELSTVQNRAPLPT